MLKPYDPAQFTLSFKGIIITGFADGEFIKAGMKEDAFSLTVGGQGDVTRVMSRNFTGLIEFSTQSTADINDLLSAIHLSDKKNGDGVGTAQLTQHNGTTAAHSDDAFIVRHPDTPVGKDMPVIKWQLLCGHLDLFQGSTLSI